MYSFEIFISYFKTFVAFFEDLEYTFQLLLGFTMNYDNF
jgi:hypothetical protein